MSRDTVITTKPFADAAAAPADPVDSALNKALYERVCELLQDNDALASALQLLASHDASSQPSEATLADLVISDDAQAVGRLVIDRLIQITWAMAEQELGMASSSANTTNHSHHSRH